VPREEIFPFTVRSSSETLAQVVRHCILVVVEAPAEVKATLAFAPDGQRVSVELRAEEALVLLVGLARDACADHRLHGDLFGVRRLDVDGAVDLVDLDVLHAGGRPGVADLDDLPLSEKLAAPR
jgi:hypothetical protein